MGQWPILPNLDAVSVAEAAFSFASGTGESCGNNTPRHDLYLQKTYAKHAEKQRATYGAKPLVSVALTPKILVIRPAAATASLTLPSPT